MWRKYFFTLNSLNKQFKVLKVLLVNQAVNTGLPFFKTKFIFGWFCICRTGNSTSKRDEFIQRYAPLMVSLNVAVPASRNEFNTFSANCSAEMAMSLADGRMDSAEFMQEIMKNIKIQ